FSTRAVTHPTPPLFPYTTLFRSRADQLAQGAEHMVGGLWVEVAGRLVREQHARGIRHRPGDRDPLLLASGELRRTMVQPVLEPRSEEHTSELQSRENLVCRLLLE